MFDLFLKVKMQSPDIDCFNLLLLAMIAPKS